MLLEKVFIAVARQIRGQARHDICNHSRYAGSLNLRWWVGHSAAPAGTTLLTVSNPNEGAAARIASAT